MKQESQLKEKRLVQYGWNWNNETEEKKSFITNFIPVGKRKTNKQKVDSEKKTKRRYLQEKHNHYDLIEQLCKPQSISDHTYTARFAFECASWRDNVFRRILEKGVILKLNGKIITKKISCKLIKKRSFNTMFLSVDMCSKNEWFNKKIN